MPFTNFGSREITYKLVYYGPGLCGKTTNVEYIHRKSNEQARGKLISLTTDSERTLFFDFCPLALGQIQGFTVRVHLYTVPGQIFYKASRALILGGADGLVFVADSQRERFEANAESVEDLHACLRENKIQFAGLPIVLQCNKQDVPEPMTVAELQQQLGFTDVPAIPAVAAKGVGVFETFKLLGKMVIERHGQPTIRANRP